MCVIRYCYLVALPLALGCVPPVPPDVPTADAGPDQTVAVGTAVTLDGSGSTDPNGETLVYFWEQTGGPTVALSDVHGVRPAFTALNESTVLTFRLTVTNRDNQSASDSVDVKVTGTIGKIPQLFVANRSVDSVVSFQYPATQDGDVSPTTHLTGLLTQLKAPTACAVPSNGTLVISNFDTPSLTLYENAASVTGNRAPDRIIEGSATLLTTPTALTLNTARTSLYVAETGFVNRIVIFDNITSAVVGGNTPPSRTIASGNIVGPLGIFLDGRDDLYVANGAIGNVAVFAEASTLNGYVLASRTLTSAAFGAVSDVLVDASNRLLVVNGAIGNNQISIFSNAPALDGYVTPSLTLIVQGARNLSAIAIDKQGTGFLSDFDGNVVYVYDNIATRSGTQSPDRTIRGGKTLLNGPSHLFVYE